MFLGVLSNHVVTAGNLGTALVLGGSLLYTYVKTMEARGNKAAIAAPRNHDLEASTRDDIPMIKK